MLDIKILGTGCPKCKALKKVTAEAVEELGIAASIAEVKDIQKIMEYGVMFTPGLVINENVVLSGRVPKKEEVIKILKEAVNE